METFLDFGLGPDATVGDWWKACSRMIDDKFLAPPSSPGRQGQGEGDKGMQEEM